MAITYPSTPAPPNNPHTQNTLGIGNPHNPKASPKQIQLLPCTRADLYTIALLEHLAFEHDDFSDLAFGTERGSEEALRMRMKQFGKFLENENEDEDEGAREGSRPGGWYTKAVVWEGGVEEVVGVAGWSLGGGEARRGEGEGRQEEVARAEAEAKSREELDEIWGRGSNVQLCEDVFVRGDEYMFGACGNREWLKLNILVVHPRHQRLGIGTRLLEQGLQFADEKGLQTVLGASPWGIGLYRKYGFVDVHEMDIRLDDYEGGEGMGRTSHVIMRRPGKGEEGS